MCIREYFEEMELAVIQLTERIYIFVQDIFIRIVNPEIVKRFSFLTVPKFIGYLIFIW